MTARLGPQIEFVQKLFTNTIPSFANLSMTGVGFTDFNHPLYAPIACGAWSSVKTKSMLGRLLVLPHKEIRKGITQRIRVICFIFGFEISS